MEEIPPAPVEAIPPANVEVALFPWIVVVAVPPMYRVSRTENLVEEACPVKRALPAIVRVFPASNVSEAVALKKSVESRVSKVCASPPLFETQVPLGIWKHPEERAIPFANVEVAVEEALRPPFSIVIPDTFILFANVEDAEA